MCPIFLRLRRKSNSIVVKLMLYQIYPALQHSPSLCVISATIGHNVYQPPSNYILIAGTPTHISGMVRLVVPTVEVIAPDGSKSLWIVALPYCEAVEAVRKVIPADHTAELAVRRLMRSSPKLARLRPGEVRKVEPTFPKRPTYTNRLTKRSVRKDKRHDTPLSEYRAYAVARDGRIIALKEMICRDDREALATAKRLARYSDIEVWNGDRFIIRLVRANK
jgi:hypothetical protein